MGSTMKMKAIINFVTKGSTYLQKTTQTRFTRKGNIRENRKMRVTDVGYEILECQSIFSIKVIWSIMYQFNSIG